MKNKVSLVTGAGSGIGAATATAVGREGGMVMVCDIDKEKGRNITDSITFAGGNASFFYLDVTEPDAHRAAVAEAKRLFGGLDVAINCAGISVGPSMTQRAVHEVDLDDWRQIMNVNLDGVFYGMRAQIPMMMERGQGAIVNVASVMSVVARTMLSPYVTSKHAMLGLTKAAALDCAVHRIRVNAVGPGYVDTPLLAQKDAATRRAYAQLHPLNRMARAEEVAESILWLCSDKSSFSTGAYYPIDGGFTAQ
jgi:NAD(P)-dependent dehydrogenase (short-subunit alcohol dehydrogenase family)